jgi:hypothetical protein
VVCALLLRWTQNNWRQVLPVPTISVNDSAVKKVCGSTLKWPQYAAYYKDCSFYTTWIQELSQGLKLSVPRKVLPTGSLRGQQARIRCWQFMDHVCETWKETNGHTVPGRRGSGPLQTFGTVTGGDRVSKSHHTAPSVTRTTSRHAMRAAPSCLNTDAFLNRGTVVFFSLA